MTDATSLSAVQPANGNLNVTPRSISCKTSAYHHLLLATKHNVLSHHILVKLYCTLSPAPSLKLLYSRRCWRHAMHISLQSTSYKAVEPANKIQPLNALV